MKRKTLLVTLAVAGLGGGAYFLIIRPSKDSLKKQILGMAPDMAAPNYLAILNRMTRQELLDVNKLIKAAAANKKITDPSLKGRLVLISKKYNIFT